MTRVTAASLLCGLAALSACATKGQVRLLEGELRSLRVETARRDSIRAAALAAIITLEQRIIDSLAAGREALRTLDVRLQGDLTEVQRQLVQVQELTGQSQQRLTQLKAQIDARAEQVEAAGMNLPTRPDSAPRPVPAAPSADQMYQSARNQQTRGALGTARMGYQELLKTYPSHALVPDALFYIGESFGTEAPDSAVTYYAQVVTRYKSSPRASTALFRMGKLEEARRNPAAARTYYERLVREYPTSDDADLARERLKALRP
ncbi:MAG TPA: tetratricopeptide repeat protein [Gemmatimonadales bacterium]|jgi:TolA-binding protein|nr:tetratricopeptide repeat protein [Gemmatimonadales bacterium]